MTRRIVVQGLGARVAVELLEGDQGADADASLWNRITHAWSRATVAYDPGGRPLGVVRARLGTGETGIVSSSDAETLLPRLTQEITHAVIGARVGELLLLHAGGVTHVRTGDSLVFVAPGGTGKSTLTRTLAASYGYLSDETIGIQPDGTIHPYEKPLSIRSGGGAPKQELSPDRLGLLRPGAIPRLTHLVLLDRQPDTSFSSTALSTVEAIRGMVNETSSLNKLPSALHMIADLLEHTGGAHRWTYSEHTDLLDQAASWLGAP